MASLISPVVADDIISENILYKLSYHGTENYKYPSDTCETYEKPKIVAIKRQFQGIKSNKEVTGYKNIYYRFTFAVEEYETVKLAEKRLQQITFPHKFKGGSWYSKNCSLRKGFSLKNKAYFLSTDAGMFSSQLNPVLNLLLKELKTEKEITER